MLAGEPGHAVAGSRRLRLGSGDVSGERPANESVRVAVTHPVLGLQVADDLHVLLETALPDDACLRRGLVPSRDTQHFGGARLTAA